MGAAEGTGTFLQQQRNAVLVGGTSTGKSHLAVAIARNCIRGGAPFDLPIPGWTINAAGGPTELVVEVERG